MARERQGAAAHAERPRTDLAPGLEAPRAEWICASSRRLVQQRRARSRRGSQARRRHGPAAPGRMARCRLVDRHGLSSCQCCRRRPCHWHWREPYAGLIRPRPARGSERGQRRAEPSGPRRCLRQRQRSTDAAWPRPPQSASPEAAAGRVRPRSRAAQTRTQHLLALCLFGGYAGPFVGDHGTPASRPLRVSSKAIRVPGVSRLIAFSSRLPSAWNRICRCASACTAPSRA